MVLNEGNQSSVHPPGLLRISTPPGTPLPGVFDHLHSHSGGEPGHNCGHKDQSQTPHTHVLFPQPSILFGYLFFQCIYTQTPRNLGCGR